ncbi:outer dense fiber protein 2-like [Asparagus officinalis]|uniref:outer dense fiber protein 2-like n=1 Tax=Asparagus officinalis TaxID=4686 RepID=UPI00098E50D0|nr:outer dense fiber protein 2-like [Asparagus officinalis]
MWIFVRLKKEVEKLSLHISDLEKKIIQLQDERDTFERELGVRREEWKSFLSQVHELKKSKDECLKELSASTDALVLEKEKEKSLMLKKMKDFDVVSDKVLSLLKTTTEAVHGGENAQENGFVDDDDDDRIRPFAEMEMIKGAFKSRGEKFEEMNREIEVLKNKKQPIVTLSICEAEYVAASWYGKEGSIENVYYVPDLKSNILSMGQLLEKGYSVFIKDRMLHLKDKKSRLLAQVEMAKNRMFKLNLRNVQERCLQINKEDVEKEEISEKHRAEIKLIRDELEEKNTRLLSKNDAIKKEVGVLEEAEAKIGELKMKLDGLSSKIRQISMEKDKFENVKTKQDVDIVRLKKEVEKLSLHILDLEKKSIQLQDERDTFERELGVRREEWKSFLSQVHELKKSKDECLKDMVGIRRLRNWKFFKTRKTKWNV